VTCTPGGFAARVVAVALLLAPAPAAAQWVVTPWAGLDFDGATSFVDFEDGVGDTKIALGGSAGWIGDGLFGLEGNVGYTPGLFDRDGVAPAANVVLSSSALVATGDLLVLTPRALVRDTLRPYVLGGLGLMRVQALFVGDAFEPLDVRYLALAVGGGAIGRLTDVSSVRFELRRVSNLSYESDHLLVLNERRSRVAFWRVSVGVQLAY
jgi:hypothetical protein